jgi:hypothetical protein
LFDIPCHDNIMTSDRAGTFKKVIIPTRGEGDGQRGRRKTRVFW